jgi:hypothetical protein
MIEQRVLSTQMGSLQARRRPLDPGMRRMIFGPIRPMEQPGFLQRLLRR